MLQKIRYRLCFNYANRLNKDGKAQVALECRQGEKKMYLSSGIMLCPNQWLHGEVVCHENAEKLTAYLIHWRNNIEDIELSALLNGRHMTLYQLKVAVKSGLRPTATLREFTASVIEPSDRKDNTKRSYRYLINQIEKDFGKITINDVTHDLIYKWRNMMHSQGLSDNTIKGRLKSLRCIVNEALRRNIISDDSFKFISIGNMKPRKVYLTISEVNRLLKASLNERESHIRDAFVFCCYTGLRFSDFTTMRSEHIIGTTLCLEQQKTRNQVKIPLKSLFAGKPLEILDRYKSVESFTYIGHNSTVNRVLKDIARKAGVKKNLHFHIARHTAATLLNQFGLQMQEIQHILGHAHMETTSSVYAETTVRQLEKSLRKAFKSDHF